MRYYFKIYQIFDSRSMSDNPVVDFWFLLYLATFLFSDQLLLLPRQFLFLTLLFSSFVKDELAFFTLLESVFRVFILINFFKVYSRWKWIGVDGWRWNILLPGSQWRNNSRADKCLPSFSFSEIVIVENEL